jgi:hypothetical protein
MAGYLHEETLFDTKESFHLTTEYGNRFSCRNLFRQIGILLLKSQYIVMDLFKALLSNGSINAQQRNS